MSLTTRLRQLCMIAACAIIASAAHAAKPLPVEAFGNLPAVERVSLAPDGQRIALLVNTEGLTTIITQNLDGKPRTEGENQGA